MPTGSHAAGRDRQDRDERATCRLRRGPRSSVRSRPRSRGFRAAVAPAGSAALPPPRSTARAAPLDGFTALPPLPDRSPPPVHVLPGGSAALPLLPRPQMTFTCMTPGEFAEGPCTDFSRDTLADRARGRRPAAGDQPAVRSQRRSARRCSPGAAQARAVDAAGAAGASVQSRRRRPARDPDRAQRPRGTGCSRRGGAGSRRGRPLQPALLARNARGVAQARRGRALCQARAAGAGDRPAARAQSVGVHLLRHADPI